LYLPKHKKKKAPIQPVKIPDFETRYKYVGTFLTKVNKKIEIKMWKTVRVVLKLKNAPPFLAGRFQ